MQNQMLNRIACKLPSRQPLRPCFMSKPRRCFLGLLVLLLSGGPINSSALATQRFDQSQREFSSPTPAELFRILSAYQPRKEVQAPLGSNGMNELEKKGREFLSSLTPEQQEQAWRFAKKYLGEHGIDSPDSKALMSQFGVPDELQDDLAEQFKALSNSGQSDFSSFKDQVRRATEKAIERTRRQEGHSNELSDAMTPLSEHPLGSLEPNRNSPGLDRPNSDLLDTGGSNSNSLNPDEPKLDASISTGPERDQLVRDSKVADPGIPDPNEDLSDLNRPVNELEAPGASDHRDSDLPNPVARSDDPRHITNRNPQPRQSPDPNERRDGSVAASDLSSSTRSSNDDSDQNQTGPRFDWETRLRELVGQGKGFRGDGNDAEPVPQGNSQYRNRNTPSQLPNDILKESDNGVSRESPPINDDWLNRIGETLSGSKRDSVAPKERLTARFDRLLVEAAKRSLDSQSALGQNVGTQGSVDSMFNRFIDQFQKSTAGHDRTMKASAKPRTAEPDWRSSFRNPPSRRSPTEPGLDVAENISTPNRRFSDLPERTNVVSSDDSGGVDLLDSLSQLRQLEVKQLFTFAALLGLVVFLAYLMLRQATMDETAVAKTRKFGKRFRKSKIQYSDDLVDAVDQFIVNKFGSDSRWWNARHAHNILCAEAPEYSAKISEMISDYVRARYMRMDVSLTESEQDRYKTTLRELTRLAEKSVVAPPPGTEG